MLPLTEELQAKKLREKCEMIIFEHVSTLCRDGNESCSVNKLFYFLHLSEKHSLTRVLDFCILVASEFTASERQEGMKQYQISTELRFKIFELADERQQIRAQDELDFIQEYKYRQKEYTMQEFVSYYYVRVIVRHEWSSWTRSDYVKDVAYRRHLRGLRLACLHFRYDKDLISEAVRTVRRDMKDEEWNDEFQHQYELLPQKIKTYLKGRKVDEF